MYELQPKDCWDSAASCFYQWVPSSALATGCLVFSSSTLTPLSSRSTQQWLRVRKQVLAKPQQLWGKPQHSAAVSLLPSDWHTWSVSFLPNLVPKITQVASQWCMALCRCRQELNTKKFSAMRGWKPQLKDICTQEETGWTYRFMKNLVLPLLSILVFYSHFTWNIISVILSHLYPEIQVNSCRYTVREFDGTNWPLPLFSQVSALFLSRNRSYTEPSQHAQVILQGWGSCLSSARLPWWPLLEPQPWPYFLSGSLYQTHREWRSSKKYGLSQGYSVNSPGPQLPHRPWLSFI